MRLQTSWIAGLAICFGAFGSVAHAESFTCKALKRESFSLTARPSEPATVQNTLAGKLKLGAFGKTKKVTLKQAPRGGMLNYTDYWNPAGFWLSLGSFHGEGVYQQASLILDRGTQDEKSFELECKLEGPVSFKNYCEISPENDPQTNLFKAVLRRSADLLDATLACGVDVNALDEKGCTALLLLTDEDCGSGASEYFADAYIAQMVESLLLAGADFEVDATDPTTGETALHKVVRNQDLATAQELLGAGADINAQDNQGFTPLMRAVEERSKKLVEAFVTQGANLELKNSAGLTALEMAKQSRFTELYEMLSVANTVTVVGDAMGQCAPMSFELKVGVPNKIIVKTSNPMLMLDSPALGISLMASPGRDASKIVTPQDLGQFEMSCGPKMGGGNPKGMITVVK